jgi:hypothetical protein
MPDATIFAEPQGGGRECAQNRPQLFPRTSTRAIAASACAPAAAFPRLQLPHHTDLEPSPVPPTWLVAPSLYLYNVSRRAGSRTKNKWRQAACRRIEWRPCRTFRIHSNGLQPAGTCPGFLREGSLWPSETDYSAIRYRTLRIFSAQERRYGRAHRITAMCASISYALDCRFLKRHSMAQQWAATRS